MYIIISYIAINIIITANLIQKQHINYYRSAFYVLDGSSIHSMFCVDLGV